MLFLGTIGRWWRERNRNIFHYFDGTKTVRADPIVIGNRLDVECPTYQELLKTIARKLDDAPVGPIRNELLEQKKAAAKTLADASRKIFDLKPLTDTEGLTDAEALNVLTQYFLFMQELAAAAEVFLN